ncbi:hypothetical protein [Nocardia sp. MW-W600-9]
MTDIASGAHMTTQPPVMEAADTTSLVDTEGERRGLAYCLEIQRSIKELVDMGLIAQVAEPREGD